MLKKIFVLLFILICFYACQKNENVAPNIPQATNTLTSTVTISFTPTETSTLTPYLSPTITMTITNSPTYTITSTYTSTNTPVTVYIKCTGTPASCQYQDALIVENGSDNNYGTLSLATIGWDTIGGKRRTLLYFDLTSIPQNANVTDVRLIVNVTTFNPSTTSIPIDAYRLTIPWNESTVTWNSISGGTYDLFIGGATITSTGFWVIFIDNQTVKGWINGTINNYGIILISGNENNSVNDWLNINTKEVSDENLRPYLQITYN